MKNSGSFMEHSMKIRVEGFNQQKLLTDCLNRGITIKDIHPVSETEMIMTIMEWDYKELSRLVKNSYRITILKESGYRPVIMSIFSKKSTIIGLILFALVMIYQSTFVSEIRVYGYEKFTETEIRNSLREAGLYEGCSKNVDVEQVKLHIYQDLDNITWIGVKYIGNLAEVTIVEGTVTPKPVDISKPCDIVADKEGFIEEIIARDGKAVSLPGTFVKPGDVLISGTIPLKSTAYGTPEVSLTERYVHAVGEVYARVPHRYVYYQEKYVDAKEPTGNQIYGFRLEFGNFKVNTARRFNSYSNSVYTETTIFKTIRPIPMVLAFAKIEEVDVIQRERGHDEIETVANQQMRLAIKENIPENTQILNNSLKFSPGENIIGISIMLETLEKIGIEKEIVIGNPTDRGTEDQNRP